MRMTRREALALAGSAALLPRRAGADDAPPKSRMGVVIHSYGLRKSADPASRFEDPLAFLQYCQARGAGGVQTTLGVLTDAQADRLRDYALGQGLFVEGSISLPKSRQDLDRFTAEIRTAERAGVRVIRSVLMTGRRYEVFEKAEDFRAFREQGRRSLELALPLVEASGVRLAVENHKDLQAPDLVAMIRRFDSPRLGVCLDTGNNLALLEDPNRTAELLAPLTFTTHIKDMGVAEYDEGFLLSEVPLGQGVLDLPAILGLLRKSRPEVRFNLEMITRDPLKVPCLTPKYWATLEDIPGRRLAEVLAAVRVRSKADAPPLPRVTGLSREEQLRLEDAHVAACLRHAAERLGV